jgi:UDP-N-acetylmuramoyl-tripeptide--D-alanyl-D-alanine ligase
VEEIPLVASWVADATKGTIVAGERGRQFTGVSIDTRTIAAGELFVAIRGERFDGTDFADAAIDAGAGGVVLPRATERSAKALAERARPSASAERPVVIEVDDTTTALQALGQAVRRESGAKVVAITGSAGKTTTKEATADFLGTQFQVTRNRGNLNNHIGLPLSLIELRHRPDVAVVELGMNHAGEISTLVRIAEPDVRVWTNVGDAHVGFFGSIEAIADAKAEILERATSGTLLVANMDDERIAERIGSFPGRRLTFGIDRDADVRATSVADRGIDGTSARVRTPRGDMDLTTPLIGRANLANVLAATAVAIDFGVPLPAIAEKAATLRPAHHRGEVVRLRNGIVVIDDSYNANPTATRRALEVLAKTHASRRIAVLGEMLELGARADVMHEQVGRAVAASKVDALFAIGGVPAVALASAAVAAGMPADRVKHFATSDEAAGVIGDMVGPGDVVLVKGSRGIETDRVVDWLRAERA